jgi:hypothetical protein
MIRTTKGVTLEGIDGVDYLSQQEVDQPTSASPDLTWRPGVPYSQERENQIIKFRTVYQNFTKGPYKGVDVITGDSGSVSGPLVDYLKTNLDVIVLDAVDRVMNTTDVQPDSNDSGSSSYFDDNLLGLKSTLGSTTGNDVWNQNLNKLIQSFQVLNAYTTVTTNIDANNKKLFAFANTYSTNALVSVDKGGVKIYKNGLANGLPLIITNANNYVSTAENRSLAKIHYPVVTTSADNMAKQTGIEDSLTDH